MSPVSAPTTTQVERWSAAIAERHSRRSYDGIPLTTAEREAMAAQCDSFRPFPAVRAVLVAEAPESLFVHRKDDRPTMAAVGQFYMGIMGSYGRIDGAPAALAFAGRVAPDLTGLDTTTGDELLGDDRVDGDDPAEASGADDPDPLLTDFAVEEQIGYVGEAAVLEATALDLDTCWVAGFFSPGTTEALIGAGNGEMVFAVSPLGHARSRLTGKERYAFQMGRQKKRLKLQHIAVGLLAKEWPAWAVAGVRAAQTAPSAMNRQPWRFRLDGETVILGCDKPDTYGVSKRIDCGIAMLHFELGVRQTGREGSWEPAGTELELDVARWRPAASRFPGL